MPSITCKTLLFLSAYLPLFAIFTITNASTLGWPALIPTAIGALAFVGLLIFVKVFVGEAEPRHLNVASVERKDSEVMAYIFTYIFPFLGIQLDSTANVVSLAVFFTVLLILHVTSNLIHINPMLSLLGYHVYEVANADGGAATIITRRPRLPRGTTLEAVMIGDELFMEKGGSQ